MAFIWTAPDPLNGTAKTRSIYITEIQSASNVKRVEIGQSILSFINQGIGEKFRLSAIEELKTTVNQLAIDFGYTGGVQNSNLLGRPYVTITKKYGQEVCHYPIINDLRQVLYILIPQIIIIPIGTVIYNWYDNGLPTVNPLAGYNNVINDPWPVIPDFIQTGVGTTCPAGYPTCDNTLSGFFRDTVETVTDISLINLVDPTVGSDYLVEGPLGGPYYQIGDNIFSVIFSSNWGIDENNFYSHNGSGGSGGVISVAPRDASEAKTTLGDFGMSFNLPRRGLYVTDNYIIMVAHGSGNTLLYGKMNKTTGGVITTTSIGFLNLSGAAGSGDLNVDWGPGYERNGEVFVLYGEYFNDGGLGSRNHYIASAVVKIDSSGAASLYSDLDTFTILQSPRIPADPIYYRWEHGNSNQSVINSIITGNDSGFYYDKRVGGSIIKIGSPAPTDNGVYRTFNGAALSGIVDYKGDTITNYNGVFHKDNYLDHAPATSTMIPIDFTSKVRVDAGSTDDVNVTWDRTTGAFRYRLQRRLSTSSIWITTKTVESDEFGLFDVFTDTITGLQKTNDYYIRILMETGQGLLLGDSTLMPTL